MVLSFTGWCVRSARTPFRVWTGSVRKLLTWDPDFPDKKIRTRRILDHLTFSYKCFGEHPSSGVKTPVDLSLEPSRIPAGCAVKANGKGLLILVGRTAIDFSEKWHELSVTFNLMWRMRQG
jgi:hypothetical protein